MKEFKSLGEFDAYLKNIVIKSKQNKLAILDAAGQLIEDEAKRKFGIYQGEVGPYQEWAPLADATMAQRERQGYTPNDPLLRSGELRDSIHHVIYDAMPNTVFIGSSSDIMVYQELGTATIPARAVLGPAAFQSKIEILKLINEGVSAWLMDKPIFTSKAEMK